MLLKRWAVPGKEAARSEEPLAAWQPCPQHYSWYKSLCFCCPKDSLIYFPLNVENRSLFFSYLYQTSGSRDNVNIPVLHRKASTQREFHVLAKDRDDRPVLLRTRLHSFQRAASLQYFGPLHPCCKRCGLPAPLQIMYLHTLGLHPESVPPPWQRQPLGQVSPALGNSPAQSSQQLLPPPWGMEDFPAHLLHPWRQACNSHLRPTRVRGVRTRNGHGKGEGSSEQWNPSSNCSPVDTL